MGGGVTCSSCRKPQNLSHGIRVEGLEKPTHPLESHPQSELKA